MQRYLTAITTLLLAVQLAYVRPIVRAETEYFPGLRKPPASINSWNAHSQLAQQNEHALIAQLSSIIEEEARRRFQLHQLQQQHAQQAQRQQQAEEYQQHRLHHLHHQPLDALLLSDSVPERNAEQVYAYPAPPQPPVERVPFALGPDDPRYYWPDAIAGDDDSADAIRKPDPVEEDFLKDYENLLQSSSSAAAAAAKGARHDYAGGAISHVDGMPSYKLKAPMEIKPQLAAMTPRVRDDLDSLVQKLQSSGQAGAVMNHRQALGNEPFGGEHQLLGGSADVVRKHLDVNTVVDLYVVAIIAGLSATLTVGMIAIGIGWYTLHKKNLAAADVEYPAYGVTGPNKDSSPSGDRRLAQSAQMYHYQHQKQQIIAMENRTHNEHRNGSMTDAESDEENEEGDYTVYECPGLAPTGEMEVKNPLFLDDPTPLTPANAIKMSSDKSPVPKK